MGYFLGGFLAVFRFFEAGVGICAFCDIEYAIALFRIFLIVTTIPIIVDILYLVGYY